MRRLATQLARHIAAADGRTDGDLVAGFLNGADGDFTELVRRHGAMVWGVCRRALPDHADAEDAFQAVFLVLVRKARRLAGCSTVGPWLHRVAAWTSRNVRRRNARRSAKSAPMPDHAPAPAADPDLPLDLDAALLALPEKYRSPVVLCHLLGLSRAEAATSLGCPEGTLSAWLARGLAKLRTNLSGYDPTKALGVAAVAVPTGLSGAAVRAAAASRAAAACASTASTIAEGVIRMFWVKKATAASVALFAVFALGVGVGVSVHQGVPAADGQAKTGTDPTAKPARPADPVTDTDKELAELKELFDRLALDRKRLAAELMQTEAKTRELNRQAKELDEMAKLIAARRAELTAKAPAKPGGFVEVTLRGEAGKFDFTVRETDANGKDIGTVVVREPEMLTKLLTRTKNDATAPKELRLVAEPPTATGGGPAYLFKACDSAGYKTVKYTGYVIGGGFTPQLKPGQKGEAPGYKWYDAAEKSPAALLAEHNEGMRTF